MKKLIYLFFAILFFAQVFVRCSSTKNTWGVKNVKCVKGHWHNVKEVKGYRWSLTK